MTKLREICGMERALEGEHIEVTALACILEGSMDRWPALCLVRHDNRTKASVRVQVS
jgi:hypothetical protein